MTEDIKKAHYNEGDDAKLLADIFKVLNSITQIKVLFENTPIAAYFNSWYHTNLKMHKGFWGYVYLEEELPQIISPDQSDFLSIN